MKVAIADIDAGALTATAKDIEASGAEALR